MPLIGTHPVNTDADGRTTFSNLGIDGVGDFRFQFTKAGLTSIQSNIITVTAGGGGGPFDETFEISWGNFTDAFGGPVGSGGQNGSDPNRISRSTALAHDGVWAAQRIVPASGENHGAYWLQFPSTNTIDFTFWQFATGWTAGTAYKWIALWGGQGRNLIMEADDENGSNHMGLHIWTPNGGDNFALSSNTITNGAWHKLRLRYTTSGSNTIVTMWKDDVQDGPHTVSGGGGPWNMLEFFGLINAGNSGGAQTQYGDSHTWNEGINV